MSEGFFTDLNLIPKVWLHIHLNWFLMILLQNILSFYTLRYNRCFILGSLLKKVLIIVRFSILGLLILIFTPLCTTPTCLSILGPFIVDWLMHACKFTHHYMHYLYVGRHTRICIWYFGWFLNYMIDSLVNLSMVFRNWVFCIFVHLRFNLLVKMAQSRLC